MCKILVMSNIKEGHRKKAVKFIKEMAVRMSVSNNDGLGYSAIDADGNLFSERWLVNNKAFKTVPQHNFGDSVSFTSLDYTSLGNVSFDKLTSITLHTRLATCERGLINVHPFIKDGTSLIHNGVIRNPNVYKPTISTCDSESLLNGYLEFNMSDNPDTIKEMVKPLEGYWAAAVYTKVDGKYVLDIFKYDASLHTVYIYDLETWVFSTSLFDIEGACDKLGFTYSSSAEVTNKSYIRISPITGEVIFSTKYEKEEAYRSYESYKKPYKPYNPPNVIKKEEKDNIKITVLDSKTFSERVLNLKTI